MCGNGGLFDQNGKEVDLRKLKDKTKSPKGTETGKWTTKSYSINGYVKWANTQKGLTEEMIENL